MNIYQEINKLDKQNKKNVTCACLFNFGNNIIKHVLVYMHKLFKC